MIFSFRAESLIDAGNCSWTLKKHRIVYDSFVIRLDPIIPDVVVEVEVPGDFDLEDFKKKLVEEHDDLHVAVETMRPVPIKENSMKRVFDKRFCS